MTKIREFRGHTSRVLHLAKSPDGSTICSASADETLRCWGIFGPSVAGSASSYGGGGGGGGGEVAAGAWDVSSPRRDGPAASGVGGAVEASPAGSVSPVRTGAGGAGTGKRRAIGYDAPHLSRGSSLAMSFLR